MAYKTEHLTQQLRAAREARNMSQRELSNRSGLTQGHISQIERGTMDPGLSTLVDVARALDLEIVLAPRKLMPAIGNVLESASVAENKLTSEQRKLVGRLERWLAEAMDQFPIASEADTLKDSLALLRHLPLSIDGLDDLRATTLRLDGWRQERPTPVELSAFARSISQLRNAAAHRDRDDATPRPAYALDEDDHDA